MLRYDVDFRINEQISSVKSKVFGLDALVTGKTKERIQKQQGVSKSSGIEIKKWSCFVVIEIRASPNKRK